jgi:uncharacterized repeat protein (TIGR03803 family)
VKTARYALQALFTPRLFLPIVFGCLFLLALIQPITLHAQTYTDLHAFNCSTDGCSPQLPGLVAQGRDGNLYGALPQGGAGDGTIYKITPSGTFSVIYTFPSGGADGAFPFGGLILGTDGNFYGTTVYGGTYGWGTIFKITPGGTLTTLHSFNDSDGCCPNPPPVQGKKAFYGVTSNQTAYSITSSGKFKLLPNIFDGSPDAPLILASDGNLYGTTFDGGPGYGTVFKLSASGAIKTIYNFDYTHGANPYGPLVQGSDGNLYGTTSQGGTAPNPGGVVFKLTLKGSINVLKNFDTNSADGANPWAGLVAGTDGNFYGAATQSNGAPYGTLFEITKGGTFTVVNDFDNTHGAYPSDTAMQHTNGTIYGETYLGGLNGTGVFWKLDAGIAPFVSIVGFPAGSSGQTVEILGQGFSSATSVMFGSGSANFTVVSDTYLTATVPSSGTSGPVTVTTSGGTLTSKQTFKVIPVLSSFSPTSGPVGTQVTITGSGFIGAKTVTFGGAKATVFTVKSDGTQITATVPTGAVTGKIKVTTAGGSATSSQTFTVN